MGAAAYNRGSRVISRETDRNMPGAQARADREASKDEVARLRGQIASLERDLARARRCLAAERAARERRTAELTAELRAARFGTSVLCRIAFAGDREDNNA